eukprot:6212597-Pleurochrysis_carterae.AAC.6
MAVPPVLLGWRVATARALEALELLAARHGRRVVQVAAHLVERLHLAAHFLDVVQHLFVRLDVVLAIRVLLLVALAALAPHGVRVRRLAVERLCAMHVGGDAWAGRKNLVVDAQLAVDNELVPRRENKI